MDIKIVHHIRKIKNILFSSKIFPNDTDKFLNELKVLEVDKLNVFQRSYCAYKIRDRYTDIRKEVRFIKLIVYNCLFVSLWAMILLFKIRIEIITKKMVYYKISNNENILPNNYADSKYLETIEMGEGFYLDNEAKRILIKCMKYSKCNFAYLFEVLFSISNYAYIINTYAPQEIITTYESSSVSPILTYYCNKNGIKHTNCMHGEKILLHCNVLGFFDKMIVWDEFYKELFIKLKYQSKSFEIYNPWIVNNLPFPRNSIDFTFYLNHESKINIEKIKKYVKILLKRGIKVKVRPHPSQFFEIKKMQCFNADILEDSKEISILQSIANTKFAVSRYSTVLFQAYMYGKEIIIDDLTDAESYEQLKKLDYIMVYKEHKLLSKIIKGNEK